MIEKTGIMNYDRIKIGIASPEEIRNWSYGEVLRPETINYRTLRPEKDGLFCERIFGTTKEWECFCGKFKSIRYKGVICDRCGVEVTHFKVRRERIGHVELACPVAHIWFYKAVPSRIGLLLDMSIITLKSVLFFEKYLVVEPGDVPDLKKFELLTESEYAELREKYGDSFHAGIGADVFRELLADLDLEYEASLLREKMASSRVIDKRKMIRLSFIEDFINSSNKPEWMILDVIPVIPPELRPMVQLEGGRFATSDLNDLYRRLINRNNRLKKLIALNAPEIIIKNEKRMLQEAVDALFDNARRKRSVRGTGNRPLKSLSDVLKGKQGRFRQNLLGKRVDYSGRSVIVVGPDLKMHQCGLPRKMALELFKPFIMRKLVEKRLVFNIKSAKKVIDNEFPEVWKILEEVVKEHPVLLNRAPTLHRLGIQAFEPVLTDEKAIRLHPLVCTAYNADFDGDQMAVHVPLSSDSQIEAWTLMLSANNLLDPANGNPIVNPSQDIVLGTFNLTNVKNGVKGEGKHFGSKEELLKAAELGAVDLQASVKLLKKEGGFADTTAGRQIFSSVLPDDYPPITGVLDEKKLKDLINQIFKKYGPYKTVVMLDSLKELGFHYSTLFGNTISIHDIIIPEEKKGFIDKAEENVIKITDQYHNGLITDDERYQKLISLWTLTSNKVTDVMMESLESDMDGHNPLYIMAKSGARGSKQQIRQLAGMRGLMAKPSGDIIEMSIVSNFKEGLSVLEYFISTHGARKGLSDTALKTADAGYLTRKLVDIAQDVTIEVDDCNTINGIFIEPIKDGDEIIERLSERVVGRFTAEAIRNPFTDEVILKEGEEVTDEMAAMLDNFDIERVKIRALVTCDSPRGVCRKCYGRNLATGAPVNIGEAVGIIASQSIGQPGTQLTMRTFHIGGIAASDVRDSDFKLPSNSVILELPNTMLTLADSDNQIVAPRRGYMTVASVFEHSDFSKFKSFNIKNGSRILAGSTIGVNSAGKDVTVKKAGIAYVNKKTSQFMLIGRKYQQPIEVGAIFRKNIGEFIAKNEVIYSFDTITEPIIAEGKGTIAFTDVVLNKTLKEEIDEFNGVVKKRIIESKEEHLQPKLLIVPAKGDTIEADLPAGALLYVEEGDKVETGKIIAGTVRQVQKTADITGGLPRVQELFEARNPSNAAVIAEIDGIVEIAQTLKGKRQIFIKNEFGDNVKHVVPSGKALLIRNGDEVRCGEALCVGNINPHDILRVSGERALYEFILENVQEVYKRQGVEINDKHIGVIIRQMLRKVEVIEPGDTPYIKGPLVDKYRLRRENRAVAEEGGQPAVARQVLLGLTKASLNTESFISSASFQETTKVLTNAAIKNSRDDLNGLKENVIIGHKIPAGTGKKIYENVSVYKNVYGDIDFIGSDSDSDVEFTETAVVDQNIDMSEPVDEEFNADSEL